MPAQVRVYETDETTLLSSFSYGSVPPNSDYITIAGQAKEVRIKNDGDQNLTAVTVAIQQAGSFDLYTYVRIADDVAGSPGTWQDHAAPALALGPINIGAAVPIHLDLIVPISATAGEAQSANLFIAGTI